MSAGQNFDPARGAAPPPQGLISFEMIEEHDPDAGPPDEMQDGFWPSLDPKAAGFIGKGGDLEDAQNAATERMRAWRKREWSYIGIKARARVAVPIGGGSFCTYVLESAGLWGTESDSSDDYKAEIFAEERAALLRAMVDMGALAASIIAADKEA